MYSEQKNNRKLKIRMVASIGSSFNNWVRILIINKFRIKPKYVIYAVVVFIVSFLLSPFAILEKILFDRKIKKTQIKEPVFIIGNMRSGTTYLFYLLSQDKQFAWITTSQSLFFHIFLILGNLVDGFLNLVMPRKRPMDNIPIYPECPQEEEFAIANCCPYSAFNGAYFPERLKEFYYKYSFMEDIKNKEIKKWMKVYDYVLKKISFKNDRKRILSKSIVNSSRIKTLLQIYPDAKFIFIYRDPYKIFLSSNKLFKKFLLPHMSFQDISDEKLESIILDLERMSFNKYLKEKNFIKKENLIEIKFEDFLDNPISHIEKIYTKLKIKNLDKAISGIKDYMNKYKNYKSDIYNIPQKTKDKVYDELKDIFEIYGYQK